MTTRKEMTKINRVITIIENHAPISKVQLVIKSGLSISYFEKLKPFVEELYPHKVRWDKEDKLWYAIKSKEVNNDG